MKGIGNMKRKTISLILILTVLLSVSATAVGASPSKVSYAIDVIAGALEFEKSVRPGQTVNFSAEELNKLLDTEGIKSVTVLSLPDENLGRLALSGVSVMKNQVISMDNIDKLSFAPSCEEEKECTVSLGLVSNGQPLVINCRIKIVLPEGYVGTSSPGLTPVLSVSTIENVPGCYYLKAAATENAFHNYRVTVYPEHGTLQLTDSVRGSFCYTPVDGYTGVDSFCYVSVDNKGGESAPVRVDVTVEKCAVSLCYCDMEGDPSLLAAMRMAERGIMVGKTVCGVAYFDPSGSVRRDEFLAMAMNVAGIKLDIDPDVTTDFDDDDKIPTYLRGYVAYADDSGYINGVIASGKRKFEPSAPITSAEAAVMVYNILGVSPSGEREALAGGDDLPDWAVEAMVTLSDLGLIENADYAGHDKNLTRARASCILLAMSDYLSERTVD